MAGRHRKSVAKGPAAKVAAAGLLSVGAAVAFAATAAADPDPAPAPPGIDTAGATAPPPAVNDIMSGPLAGLVGAPQPAPGQGAPVDLLLSQYPTPVLPGSQPAPPLDYNTAMSGNSYLLPQMFRLSQPDEGNMYSIAPGDVQDHPQLMPALKGAHALWHAGMGKLDPDQLGQPLPGTVAPPGSNLPPGVVDYLPETPPWNPPVPPPPAPPLAPPT